MKEDLKVKQKGGQSQGGGLIPIVVCVGGERGGNKGTGGVTFLVEMGVAEGGRDLSYPDTKQCMGKSRFKTYLSRPGFLGRVWGWLK